MKNPSAESVGMKKHHIMIVDDDTYTIELYKLIIEWTPYRNYIRTEEDASRALEILGDLYRNDSDVFPDYILLDLKMPEMHGFEFIRRFEEDFPGKKGRTQFIITTSSMVREEEEAACRFDSVRAFLIKPLPRDYIERLVTEGFYPDL
jgi:CheY-like chemotaxis protein